MRPHENYAETNAGTKRHLWPVLGKHSYELVGVGLAALVQEAGTHVLSPGRHLWGGSSFLQLTLKPGGRHCLHCFMFVNS